MKTDTQKFRPLSAKCAGVCTATLVFTLAACFIAYKSSHLDDVSQLIWLMPASLAVLHCVLVVLSVFRWNPYVYLCNDAVKQVQWGKEIVIPYSKISDAKVVRSSPYPATIIVFGNGRKIYLDSSKENVFLAYCTNKEVKDLLCWER